MIIGQQKPLDKIKQMIADYQKILILGCGTCVTVCFAGGEKEVGILASALRMATGLEGQNREFTEATVQRQCEYEYNQEVADLVKEADAVLSLACGIGVQTMNEQFPETITLPGLNTSFLGQPVEEGVWDERCQACGNCILDKTAGICPIARCSKSLLNGPCGGSKNGKCEIAPDIACAWQLVYDRLKTLGKLELMTEIQPARDWSTSRDGGPRKIVREDLRL
ncbi:MAG: methylenetetrahydrofolate reductase C-terminal domain-containing protein [Anaerolineae bacterium]